MAEQQDPASRPNLSTPPEVWAPLLMLARLATRPLERFLRIQAASGVLLLLAAGVALLWANSPWGATYHHFWQLPVGLRLGPFQFDQTLEWVVNDVLMVVFFFVAGLEIRRELHHGELSEWRRAVVPVAAAVGGMLAPAVLYLLVAGAPATRSGWGVPMATDIAFAVGVLALLGPRVPPALRVLLLALAVIDDLGAIVVIGLFYTEGVSLAGMLVAAAGLVVIIAMQRVGVRSRLAYVMPGAVVWAGVAAAGIHPTIAGVVVGLMTPVKAWIGPAGFLSSIRSELDLLTGNGAGGPAAPELTVALRRVNLVRRETLSPAEGLIEALHPWVAFGIMPLFALANAGVSLQGVETSGPGLSVTLGVLLGLLVGKPLGVVSAVTLMRRAGWGELPAGLGFRHVLVLGLVAGVGFTMSLFVARLAFAEPAVLDAAKLGVIAASSLAGVASLVLGRFLFTSVSTDVAATADAAEASTEQ